MGARPPAGQYEQSPPPAKGVCDDPWKTLYRALPADVYEMLCRIEDRLGALHKTGPFPAHGRSDTRYKEVFAHTWRYFVTRIEELDEDTFRRLFE